LQKERMRQNMLTGLDRYHRDYGITHKRLQLCGKAVPVLHPGPVNRGVEMAGALMDDRSICLIEEQVRNGIPIRMALLYLMAAAESSLVSGKSVSA
ncbi:MAG: aspartate carbamoyltransferase, partial [Prochlorococcus sp.]